VKKTGRLVKDEKGFTLVEIIAVLVVLGILAAVAIPKYMDITSQAREKAAQGQIAEAKGRLSTSLAGYLISNSGSAPATGAALVTHANTLSANTCPTSSTTEGDFTWICAGASDAKTVTITVSAVQGTALSTAATGTFTFN